MTRNNKLTQIKIQIPTGRGVTRLRELRTFSNSLIQISHHIGFNLSSRGWCYQLEGLAYIEGQKSGIIDKGKFARVQKLISECSKKGLLPKDFLANEEARSFSCVNNPTQDTPKDFLKRYLASIESLESVYEPDYWEGEEVYIQMLVEKVDLKTLFLPVCQRYHVPIATTKGWSSVQQRIEIIERFKKAEQRGQVPVLLYCGDLDPYGIAISNTLKKHLDELYFATGWTTYNLCIRRFGLNADFVDKQGITWIPNLISGSGKQPDMSNPTIQSYVSKYGHRKVEANALVVMPTVARTLCKDAIEKYTGPDILKRFKLKEEIVSDEFSKARELIDFQSFYDDALHRLKKEGVL